MFTSKYFNLGQVVCTATLNKAMQENKQFTSEVMSAKERFTLLLTEYRKRQEITQLQSVSLVRDRIKMCGLLEI